MRRWLVGLLVVGALAAALVWTGGGALALDRARGLVAGVRPPIKLGLIHSQSGELAISEASMIDAEVLAMEEINARGGVAGRLLKWEVADGRSDPATFASQAARLIDGEKVDVLVGGWTAECRKAMLAVVEQREGLLIFPANYEGIERSPNAIYSGGAANQVVLPAVRWCFDDLKARRFFVVGSEEIWSRVVCELAKDGVKAAGGTLAGEAYQPLVGGDAATLVESIRVAKSDVVLNLMVGDGNIAFFGALRKAGLTPETLPVVAFNVAEDELKRFQNGDFTGHYAAWSYFQSIARPENVAFVRRFKARYGEARVVSDSMVAAYDGVMIWSHAADEAGTGDPKAVIMRFDRQSFDAPEGIVTIDPDSRTAWRPFYLGRGRPDGQFEVVWSLTKPILPVTFVGTRSPDRWRALVADFKAQWGGRWSASPTARAFQAR